MWLSPSLNFDSLTSDPYRLIELGWKDPSTVFTKKDPHPLRKLRKEEFRCINPVSAVDQLVESALFSEYAEILKDRKYESGSALGIGFTDS
jgi:hypothetical protein